MNKLLAVVVWVTGFLGTREITGWAIDFLFGADWLPESVGDHVLLALVVVVVVTPLMLPVGFAVERLWRMEKDK